MEKWIVLKTPVKRESLRLFTLGNRFLLFHKRNDVKWNHHLSGRRRRNLAHIRKRESERPPLAQFQWHLPIKISIGHSSADDNRQSKYRVIRQLWDLGWVDSDFSCSTVCPVQLGLMWIRQNRLCSWVRWWNTDIKVNPTQVSEQMNHPVESLREAEFKGMTYCL